MSRAKRAALAASSAVAVLAITVLAGGLAWTHAHPCWRYSNAAWCGHFCDDDPCACPDRHAEIDPYGSGPGCPDP